MRTSERIIFALILATAPVATPGFAFDGAPEDVAIAAEEAAYLCDAVNRQLRCALRPDDAVYTYSGVRCLVEDDRLDPAAVTRDYVLDLARASGHAPVLTVLGGKITTYRRLAEDALARLSHCFPRSRPWTARNPLPGGDFAHDGFESLVERTRRTWPFLSDDHARRLTRAYGTRVDKMLKNAAGLDDLGTRFGADLTAAEVRYLMTTEWARTADDVLWRRSKLGLRFSDAQRAELDRFMAQASG
jgi:glycerol-3-phosphate dehydrogenase